MCDGAGGVYFFSSHVESDVVIYVESDVTNHPM